MLFIISLQERMCCLIALSNGTFCRLYYTLEHLELGLKDIDYCQQQSIYNNGSVTHFKYKKGNKLFSQDSRQYRYWVDASISSNDFILNKIKYRK